MEADSYMLLSIVFLLILLFLTIFAFAVYSGLFYEIDVKTCKPPFDQLEVAYKFAQGPYRYSSELFTEAHSIAPDYQCIGVYYDDPKKVSSDGLRYIVGVVIKEDKDNPDLATRQSLIKNGYSFTTFPAVDHIVMSNFPFRGTLSVVIAIARVYPLLGSYVNERKLCAHPFVEIYQEDNILFFAPLSKQCEFYVPEWEGVESEDLYSHGEKSSDEEILEDQNVLDDDASLLTMQSSGSLKAPLQLSKRDSQDSTIEVLHVENSPPPPTTNPEVILSPSLDLPVSQTKKCSLLKKSDSDKSSSSSFEELSLEPSHQ